MSDEKLAEEFIEKRWPNFKHCVLLESKHRDLYCRCDLSYSFIAGLKAERERSKKLVEALSWALDSVCKHEGDSQQDTNRTWCLYCQSWVYKSDIENLKKAEAILKEYEKEGAE